MLQFTCLLCKPKSHLLARGQHPNAGTRFGRNYTRGFIRYGFGGFGMSTYSAPKDRRFRVEPNQQNVPNLLVQNRGLATVTRTLSPNFRTFALADGGVFISHPSHAQIMRWGQKVLSEEVKATGMTSMDAAVNSRIQALIANNTIENVALNHWRRTHMWNLVKTHGQLHHRWDNTGFANMIKANVRS